MAGVLSEDSIPNDIREALGKSKSDRINTVSYTHLDVYKRQTLADKKIQWNKAQVKAIESRDGSVLVSAAAGSGKMCIRDRLRCRRNRR